MIRQVACGGGSNGHASVCRGACASAPACMHASQQTHRTCSQQLAYGAHAHTGANTQHSSRTHTHTHTHTHMYTQAVASPLARRAEGSQEPRVACTERCTAPSSISRQRASCGTCFHENKGQKDADHGRRRRRVDMLFACMHLLTFGRACVCVCMSVCADVYTQVCLCVCAGVCTHVCACVSAHPLLMWSLRAHSQACSRDPSAVRSRAQAQCAVPRRHLL